MKIIGIPGSLKKREGQIETIDRCAGFAHKARQIVNPKNVTSRLVSELQIEMIVTEAVRDVPHRGLP